MKPAHIEDISVEAYEAGQIRASEWDGLMPSPIPQIYMKHIVVDAKKFASRYDKVHRDTVMHYWCNGFLDWFIRTT